MRHHFTSPLLDASLHQVRRDTGHLGSCGKTWKTKITVPPGLAGRPSAGTGDRPGFLEVLGSEGEADFAVECVQICSQSFLGDFVSLEIWHFLESPVLVGHEPKYVPVMF